MAAAALRAPAWTSTTWIWIGTRLRELSILTRMSSRGSGTSTTATSPLVSALVTARHRVVLPLPGGPVMPTDFTSSVSILGAGDKESESVLKITDDAAAVLERAYDAAGRFNPGVKVRVYRTAGQVLLGFADR